MKELTDPHFLKAAEVSGGPVCDKHERVWDRLRVGAHQAAERCEADLLHEPCVNLKEKSVPDDGLDHV